MCTRGYGCGKRFTLQLGATKQATEENDRIFEKINMGMNGKKSEGPFIEVWVVKRGMIFLFLLLLFLQVHIIISYV